MFKTARALAAIVGLCIVAMPGARPALAQGKLGTLYISSPDGPEGSYCTGPSCCVEGSTDVGKTCITEDFSTTVWKADYSGEVRFDSVEKRLSKREVKKLGITDSYGDDFAFGLADASRTIIVKPTYKGIRPISDTTAIARRFDDKVVLLDLGSGTERPSAYSWIWYYEPAGEAQPYLFFARLPDAADDRTPSTHDYAFLRPDGGAGAVLPNINIVDDTHLMGGVLMVDLKDPDSDTKATALFNVRGEYLATVPRVRWLIMDEFAGIEMPYVWGALNPARIGTSDGAFEHYILPIDETTGAPRKLPEGALGFDKIGDVWALVYRTNGEYRYQVGDTPLAVLAQTDTSRYYRNIRYVNISYGDFQEGLTPLDYSILREKYAWPEWLGNLWYTMGQLMNGDWVFVAGGPSGEYRGKTPEETFALAFADTYNKVIGIQTEVQANQARQAEVRAKYIASKAAYFEAHLGVDGYTGRCVEPLHSYAATLGPDYIRRYVDTYGACTDADVEIVCRVDSAACNKSRGNQQAWREEEAAAMAAADRADAARAAFASRVSQGWNPPGPDDNVSVLVIEGGRMQQKVMTRRQYDTYH